MIYLKIGNYTNKGDGLMLHSIMNRLNDQTDLVCLSQVADYKVRASMGLYQALWFESMSPWQNQLLAKAFPSFLKKKYGLVADGEFDAVIDASGFAYGDQWGEPKIKLTADKVERWKKQGKKIIFLPQSWGSFRKPEVRKHFQRIVAAADLIYTRDKTSHEYAMEASGNSEKIRQAPDFTGALRGKKPDWFEVKEKMACIIPNHRMIDSTDDKVGPRYLPFLKDTYQAFEKLGMNPFVLVHERVDYDVALELQQSLGKKIKIVYDDSPLVLRGIIAECHIVLSSRFHGLISTLSQSVPCLGTRWAHKFERVMEEYGMSDYLVSPLDAQEEIMQKIIRLDQSPTREQAIESISRNVAQHQQLNDQMWKEVEQVLGLKKQLKKEQVLSAV